MALDGSTGIDPSGGPQSSPGGALDIGIQLHQFGIKGALLMLLAQKKHVLPETTRWANLENLPTLAWNKNNNMFMIKLYLFNGKVLFELGMCL